MKICFQDGCYGGHIWCRDITGINLISWIIKALISMLQGPYYIIKWAATCDFQQYGILTCVDSDEHAQPPDKVRNSKFCLVSSLTVIVAKALIRLCICAGWSEPLLLTHTRLLEISCRGSNNDKPTILKEKRYVTDEKIFFFVLIWCLIKFLLKWAYWL